jgi:signal transduction histidine kinase
MVKGNGSFLMASKKGRRPFHGKPSELADITAYAARIAGAALRHDFGLHVTSIGRNGDEIRELIDAKADRKQILYKYPRIQTLLKSMEEISDRLHDQFNEVGELLKPENYQRFQLRFGKLNRRIEELIGALKEECKFFERYTLALNDDEIRTMARDSVNNADRIQLMYSGLHLFFRLQNLSATDFEPVNVRSLILRVARTIRTDPVGLHLSSIPIAGDVTIEAIPSQLTSLFQNLLHNGAKFSALAENPMVKVELKEATFRELRSKFSLNVYPTSPGEQWLESHVLNAGPKIAREDQRDIFKLYFTKAPAASNITGSGMGLAIAKLIVMIHGGLIFPDLTQHFTDIVVLLPLKHRTGLDPAILIQTELARQRAWHS